MLSVLDPMAANDVAASSFSSASLQPWIVFVVVALVLLVNLTKAMGRRKRANQNPTYGTPTQNGQRGAAHQPAGTPQVGTLLNGVPMNTPGTLHGQQGGGFANERMRAEAELKRQLDALDAARRSGQVTAEQYAVHREAIFKAF